MGTRTVRLDEKTEELLQKVRKRTGLSISEVLKRGVQAYSDNAVREPGPTPYEVFRRIHDDNATGGWSEAPARDAKKAIRDVIARKHRR